MRLHEYEAADIFYKEGIAVPRRGVAETIEEALDIADRIGFPVVLKAQVLVGGRGLAGGIKIATTIDELEVFAGELLDSEIRGLPVKKVLVCGKADVMKELYVGITIDGFIGKPVIIVSSKGGVSIEETAQTSPEKIVTFHVEPGEDLYLYQARNMLKGLGLSQRLLIACSVVIERLYKVFKSHEAIIAEINPLAVLLNGGVMALDAVLEIDNSAVSRIKYTIPDLMGRIENPLERKGREIGITYVDLDGDIGLISSGAGLGMASMDIIGQRMRPANFLETGGGITDKLLYKCMELLMMKEGLRAIFINIYGGINPIHEGAKGVVRYIEERNVKIPIVAKALGNLQEETWEIFRSGGVHVVTEAATEMAIDKLFEIVGPK
jgi:succinyl-CoA synthetase beta subunit